MKQSVKDGFAIAGIWTFIIGLIGLLVFSPVITFGCAWVGGLLLKACVGDTIAAGMNLMLDTNRFTPDFIPLACATLATIGRYFKSSVTTHNKKDN